MNWIPVVNVKLPEYLIECHVLPKHRTVLRMTDFRKSSNWKENSIWKQFGDKLPHQSYKQCILTNKSLLT